MKITALDIHQKEFTHGMRGYREDEVDDFLDQVAAEFDALTREIAALTKRVQEAEAKAIGLDAERNAINSALLIAQRSADDLMDKARGEVGQIIADAEAKGAKIVHEALATKRELLAEIKRLKAEEETFRTTVQRVVAGTLQAIDEVKLPSSVEREIDAPEVDAAVVSQEAAVEAPEFVVPTAAPAAAQPSTTSPVPAPVASAAAPAAETLAAQASAQEAVLVVEEVAGADDVAPSPSQTAPQGLIIGEVGAAPALNVELEEPVEFQFGGASVWGESDDDIEIEEID